MHLVLAEFCGRWGCTWQEGIVNLFLVTLFSKGGWIFLLGILFLVGLFFVGGFITVYEFFVGSDTPSISERIDKLKKAHQPGQDILPTAKFVGQTVRVANKAIRNHRQEKNSVNQANPQQLDIPEPDKNAINNVSDENVNNTVESPPQHQRIWTATKFLGRTLRNIAKD